MGVYVQPFYDHPLSPKFKNFPREAIVRAPAHSAESKFNMALLRAFHGAFHAFTIASRTFVGVNVMAACHDCGQEQNRHLGANFTRFGGPHCSLSRPHHAFVALPVLCCVSLGQVSNSKSL